MDEEARKYLRQISRILSCLIFDVMQHKRPFNSELCRKLLEKYKTRNPENLTELLDKDLRLSD